MKKHFPVKSGYIDAAQVVDLPPNVEVVSPAERFPALIAKGEALLACLRTFSAPGWSIALGLRAAEKHAQDLRETLGANWSCFANPDARNIFWCGLTLEGNTAIRQIWDVSDDLAEWYAKKPTVGDKPLDLPDGITERLAAALEFLADHRDLAVQGEDQAVETTPAVEQTELKAHADGPDEEGHFWHGGVGCDPPAGVLDMLSHLFRKGLVSYPTLGVQIWADAGTPAGTIESSQKTVGKWLREKGLPYTISRSRKRLILKRDP